MKWLSRKEEFVLLAILALEDNAYGVTIKLFLEKATDKSWSIGATYDVLDRLLRKKFVSTKVKGAVAERGGKSKRLYLFTPKGLQALEELREMQQAIEMNKQKPAFDSGDIG
jgi:PadR family transcriptional regulator PadR